jgi:hypothetical protein
MLEGNDSYKKTFIDEKLNEVDKICQENKEFFTRLIFPMNSTGAREGIVCPYHWTLLVFDNEEGLWFHYNSKRNQLEGDDPDMNDALMVVMSLTTLLLQP